jgi:hypothetical protein
MCVAIERAVQALPIIYFTVDQSFTQNIDTHTDIHEHGNFWLGKRMDDPQRI